MNSAVIDAAGLHQLVSTLIDLGYTVVGPTVSDNAIVLSELASADDLPMGWGVDVGPGHYRLRRRDDDKAFGHSAGPQSWKQFLHPPRQKLWSSAGDEPEDPPRYAFLGVRGCDLAAIATLNGVLGKTAHPDQGLHRTVEPSLRRRCQLHRTWRTVFLRVHGHGAIRRSGLRLGAHERTGS
jgi:hypothetical protein